MGIEDNPQSYLATTLYSPLLLKLKFASQIPNLHPSIISLPYQREKTKKKHDFIYL